MIDIERTLRLLDVAAESNFVQAEAIDAIDYLLRENARLRDALQPFAARLDELEKMKASKYACATSVEIEHLRAAAAAIREGGKE